MRRLLYLCGFFLSLGLMPGIAVAAPILVPNAGQITGTVFILDADPANPVYDVHGQATVDVFDTPGFTPIGPGSLLGVDPAFPVSNVLFLNDGPTEFITLDFMFGTSTFVGNLWTLLVSGSGTATDPVLAGFLVPNNLGQFSFLDSSVIFGAEEERIGQAFTFQLDFIAAPQTDPTAVPEPATLGLLGAGLLAAVRRRRTKSNKAA